MLKFWNSPYPFNDFIVHTTHKKGEDSAYPIEKLKTIGINNFIHKKLGNPSCMIATTFYDNELNTIISGVVQHKNTFIFGQKDMPKDIKISESEGIFTSIEYKKDEIKLSQDILGCGTLFYAQFKGDLIISNRYHLLLLYLSWIGFKGTLNRKKIISNLYSYTTFLLQNISNEMDIDGTYQLSFDKELIINNEGWKICEKESVKQLLQGCDESERKILIENAKNEIIGNVESVISSGSFSKYVADLSGGFDSRAVLAAILNIPNSTDLFEVNTNNVPGSNDLTIACGIRNKFEFEYYEEINRSQYPISIYENLQIWRSYFMGTYYRMGVSPWSPKGGNYNQIRFSGGCGELYKSFWYKIYGDKIGKPQNIYDLSMELVGSFHRIVSQNISMEKVLVDLIADELNNIPGNTPLSKLDNHYMFFRNRYHFGMRAYEFFHDGPIWFPLMSKSLFKLSNSLPLEEKNNNNIILDITMQLYPDLVKIDYDSKPLEENEYLRLMGVDTSKKILLNSDISDWEESKKKNNERLQSMRKKMDSLFNESWRNVNSIIDYELYNVFNSLKKYNEDFSMLLDDTLMKNIERYKENRNFIGTLYAKLSSLKDQIDIFM